MAGIYIHIPFCRKACTYCNFHFSVKTSGIPEMSSAIEREIALRIPEVRKAESLYLGGGTPSLLDEKSISALFNQLYGHFNLVAGAEITLEANPEDLSAENLKLWRKLGVNRLSIGVQSLSDQELLWMNRAHSANDSKFAVSRALDAGFKHVSLDFIFGSPLLSHQQWEEHLKFAFSCGAEHLSCYAFTREPKTKYDKEVSRGIAEPPDDSVQSTQYKMLWNAAQNAGWDFYEISNLAKPGHRAVHNSNYWKGLPYWGFGPSAHSFDGHARSWNIADNAAYVKSIADGLIPQEKEILTFKERFNEYIMTALRTREGVDGERASFFSAEGWESAVASSQPFIENGWMEKNGLQLNLTLDGRLFADYISSELMLANDE